ncbi:unnamed protein product [Camellia sinensis]
MAATALQLRKKSNELLNTLSHDFGGDDHASANPNAGSMSKLKELVKRHSELINYPIYLWIEKTTEKEISEDEDEETKKEEFQ